MCDFTHGRYLSSMRHHYANYSYNLDDCRHSLVDRFVVGRINYTVDGRSSTCLDFYSVAKFDFYRSDYYLHLLTFEKDYIMR